MLLGRRRLFRGFGGLEKGGFVSLGSFYCGRGKSVSLVEKLENEFVELLAKLKRCEWLLWIGALLVDSWIYMYAYLGEKSII